MRRGWLSVFLIALVFVPVFAQDNGLKIGDTTWTFNGEIRFMYTDQTDPYMYAFEPHAKAPDPMEMKDSFNRMYQRYRFGVEGAMSERLKAVFTLQVGDEQWGNKNYNEREVNIKTLYAYLQFAPEFLGDNTSIRVGLQPYDDIFQYSIYSDEAIGVLVNHKTDAINANAGFFTLRDDDVDNDWDAADDGDYYIWPLSETLFVADMNYKMNDALNLKGAFYYDYIRKAFTDIGDDEYYQYGMAFFGAGFDYMMNDSLNFGGHFVMRTGKLEYYDTGVMEFDVEGSGWFAYAYTTYTMDKFSAKVNFGYTPFDYEENADGATLTSWSGAFPLVDYGFAEEEMFMFINGNQWQTAYGLEYFGRGDVCDRQALNGGYGGFGGLMVISANLSYDFMYANFGIMRATVSDDMMGDDTWEKSIGTELDLGIKTEVMKGLEFRAVYAMFFAGDWYQHGNPDYETENAHEMSMLLRYAF